MTDYPLILTVDEGAKLLRVGKHKMWDWIYGGRIPCIRDGRIFRLNRDKLLEIASSGLLEEQPIGKER